jgi:hypothetical protein
VVTGSTDYLELERGSQELIKVQPDTVFSVREVQRGQEKETVLSTAAGAVSFRFDRITGREPMLGSPSVAAGVRGTEVTVYAGDDGTTLFLVTSGEVAVDSAGKETVLTAGQASEVLPGAEPSDAFEWKGRALDFSTWNDRRLAAFLDDPAVGVRRIRDQIAAFGDRIDELYPQYEETYQRLEEERDKNEQIVEEEGEEALQQHRDEVVGPLIQESQALILNVRYNAVSALSLKRFVLGKMYMNMKTRYIFDSENPTYREFLRVYREAVEDFENRIVPHLVPADI